MDAAFILQIVNIYASVAIILFIGYYLYKLRGKEVELEHKEKQLEKSFGKLDTNYHEIVTGALEQERKILEDATSEANKIVTNAEYVETASKELVNKALEKMMIQISNDAQKTSETFLHEYEASLKKLSGQTLTDFEEIAGKLKKDLQQQIEEFHQSLMPAMKQQLDAYRDEQLQQTDKIVASVIRRASQDIFNKSISADDHQKLVLDALEKAKKEGAFD